MVFNIHDLFFLDVNCIYDLGFCQSYDDLCVCVCPTS